MELKKNISIAEIDQVALFGRNDRNLSAIESSCGVSLVARGDMLLLDGPAESIQRATGLLNHVIDSIRLNPQLGEEAVKFILEQSRTSKQIPSPTSGSVDDQAIRTYRSAVRARGPGQATYLRAIEDNDIVFAIGPAGTGKTYLAVAAAVAALRQKEVSRIVLARPAVEAGESLGFLPGALEEKVDPYLRPLYDALQDLLEPERLSRFQSMKIVEVAPLAFMRGRTLNDAFVILDEAQNTTPPQMKMFLTRLGARSKAVVTGDITQTDLPQNQPSGLTEVRGILTEIDRLAFVYLTEEDVVRNPLVQRIVQAYERFENRSPENTSRSPAEQITPDLPAR